MGQYKKNDMALLAQVVQGKIGLSEASATLKISKKKLVKKLQKHFPDWAKPDDQAPVQLQQLQIEDRIISNHLIAGRWIIPAAYMLAHIYQHLSAPAALTKIIFKKPGEVKGVYPIHTRVDETGFRFCSQEEVLAEGCYTQNTQVANPLNPAYLQLPQTPLQPFYAAIKPLGYGYGPLLQVMEGYFADATQVIYRLKDQDQNPASAKSAGLNPFVLDGIFQCLLHAAQVETQMAEQQVMFLPYKIQGLALYKPMPKTCFAVIERSGLRVNDKEIVGSVRVYDKRGAPVLALEDMTLIKLTFGLTHPADSRFVDPAVHTYWPQWLAAPANAPDTAAEALLPIVAGSGYPDLQRALVARYGQALSLPSHEFDFTDTAAWSSFWARLPPAVMPLLIYLPPPVGKPLSSVEAEPVLAGLLALCQSLLGKNLKVRLRIPTVQALPVAATDLMSGYAYGGIAGFLQTLRLESALDATQIDLDTPEYLTQALLAECGPLSQTVVAYRNRVRCLPYYQPAAVQEPIALQPGVYIIAGGAGGIGRKLCIYLASRYAGLHFAWLGRSPWDRDKQEAAMAVQALGAKVSYFQADLTQPASTAAAIAQIRPLGVVRGVIHSGGSNAESLIRSKDWDSFRQVYNAKARSIELLDALTADLPLDFLVVFASTIGLTGSTGQCDYAAANAFLDSFVHWRQRQADRPGKSIAIDWTLWHDGGMGLDDRIRNKFLQKTGVIRAALAFPLLERLLASSQPQWIVAGNERYFQTQQPAPALAAPAPAKMTKTTQKLAGKGLIAAVGQPLAQVMNGALASLLGVNADDIDIQTDLRELGLDSITIFGLSSKIEADWGITFDATLLYEHRTLQAVANIIATAQPEAIAASLGLSLDSLAATVDPTPVPVSAPVSAIPAPKPAPVSADNRMDIAIIGLAGRYPGCADVESYWRALMAEADLISEIPPARWDWRRYFGDPKTSDDSRTYSKWGGFLENIRRFDAEFFRISPREAELMDPQQRLLLEEAWHVLEDAGYRPGALANSDTGVFIGISNDDYSNLLNQEHIKKQLYTATGSYLSIAANRISFFLGLNGPSIAIDTACASSLVAICQAVSALRAGECSLAIAGGVNLCITPRRFMAFSHAGMLSADGRCKTFDAAANGYVRGEGVGLVLLKPAQQAIADGDYIYGIIKGSRVNHGGLNTTITAPSAQAQSDLIMAVMKQANIDPASVSLMEAHGTGTSLGDPLEIRGLKKAFAQLYQQWGKAEPAQPHLAIGAVKTNIGHLEAASGVAGLTKVLMGMKYGYIPKNLHFQQQNPAIDLTGTPFYFPLHTQRWQTPQDARGQAYPRRAGVSSFGFGGANAHLLVEAYNNVREACLSHTQPLLFPLSAATEPGLRILASQLASYLAAAQAGDCEPAPNLHDIAYTLQTGRDALEHRAAICAADLPQLLTALQALATGNLAELPIWTGYLVRRSKGPARYPTLTTPRQLAAFWVAGGVVRWEELDTGGKRTPLPGYPFAGEDFWLPEPQAAERYHPLLGQPIGAEPDDIRFRARLSGREFFLADHQVDGQQVLPGAALLELARAAAAAQGWQTLVLETVAWSHSAVGHPGIELETQLQRDGESFHFTVSSPTGTVYAQGQFSPLPPVPLQTLDVQACRASCTDIWDVAGFYANLQALKLQIQGGAFQVIQTLAVGTDAVLAAIELNPAIADSALALPPALLDGAFQTCYALLFAVQDRRLQIPFSVERVAIYAPLPPRCLVYTRRTRTSRKGIHYFDLQLATEAGRILVEITGFVPRPLHPARGARDAIPATMPGLLSFPQWRPWLSPPVRDAAAPQRTLLLFDTDEECWQTLVHQYQQPVILVKPGASFRACAPGVFELYPDAAEDYRQLLMQLDSLDAELGGIIYLWGRGDEQPYLPCTPAVEGVFNPLFRLTQALLQTLPHNKLRLVLPYHADSSERAAAHQAVSGFAYSLAKERPGPLFTLLGLEQGLEPTFAWVEQVLQALSWDCASGSQFRLRDGAWQQLDDTAASPAASDSATPLRPAGCYLITGGRGALGRLLAAFLCQQYGAKVVLSGRGAADTTTHALLAQLNALGGAAYYYPADLAQPVAIAELIQHCEQTLGQLHGIFHLAGQHQDQALADKSLTAALQVLAPKVQGTLWLDQATAAWPLDFFCLFSSLVPLLGIAGQTDYAFANAFLDSFVAVREAARAQGLRQGRTLSINWPHWHQGGMQLTPQMETWLREVHQLRPLETAEGMALLADILAKGWCQVAISPRLPMPIQAADMDQRPLAEQLSGMIQQLLKLKQLDPTKPLHEYGADSVNLIELTNAINQRYRLKLTPVIFFEYQTLNELVRYLATQFKPELQAILPPPIPAQAQGVRPLSANSGSAIPAVAIVGMAGRMPSSADLAQFWQQLAQGLDLITEVPPDRWDWRDYEGDPATDRNRTYCRWGGFMPNIDQFDHAFFGLTQHEAALMDPQQRLLLQLTWQAIEDAGHRPSDLAGTDTGVFMGVSTFDYFDLMKNHQMDIEAHTATGVVHSILANRISWYFDLHGPSFPIDTACSSSLLAVHQAMEAISTGSCRQAIVGGINLLVSPTIHISFGKAGMLSPDGHCKTFDAAADGYVRSEGAGVLYLRPLADALADGDPIYAVLRGSASNHGGRAQSLTAPNPKAQADLVGRALRQSGFDPQTITYIEAHGTGTRLGDPIEIQGLKKAFARRFAELNQQPSGEAWCGIGSVKTNIGHLEAGAGMAGLCKILLALRHGELPPNLQQTTTNPYLELTGSPFYLVKQRQPWARLQTADGSELPRRAAISSFGFGGANAHLVLEEYLPNYSAPIGLSEAVTGPFLLVLSARDTERLRAQARQLAHYLAQTQPDLSLLADIAYTLQVGREPMQARLALSAADAPAAIAQLQLFAAAQPLSSAYWQGQASAEPPAADPQWQLGRDGSAIAAAFVQGSTLDWAAMQPSTRKRLHLPGYVFAPTRCWLTFPADHPPEGGVPRLRPQSRDQSADLAHFHLGFERLEQWAINGLIQVLCNMQVLSPAQTRYLWREWQPVGLAPGLQRLFASLPALLVQAGLASYTAGVLAWHTADSILAAQQRDLTAEAVGLRQDYPELSPHLGLLQQCLAHWPTVLRGQLPATEVLFPQGDDSLVRNIYRDNCHADYLNRLLATRLIAQPNARPLRILEVGAGTGGATAQILAALAQQPEIQYSYTDVSRHFLAIGQRQFAQAGPQLHFAVLDLEQDPLAQGFAAASFDVIIAANVLHATHHIRTTLQRLATLLQPGGRILINELTQPQAFVTLSFGLLAGWWQYEEEESRGPGSPLLNLVQWRAALEASGFEQVQVYGAEAAGKVLQQHILEARRGIAVKTPTRSNPKAVLLSRVQAALSAELQTSLQDTRALPLDKTFVELGIDSIFGVGLLGRLNHRFGLTLNASVLFDYPTPQKLAAHLADTYTDKLAVLMPVEPAMPEPPEPKPPKPPLPAHLPLVGGNALGIVVTAPSEPGQLALQSLHIPAPGPGQVSIRVQAFSLNYGDLLCIKGLYPTMPAYPFTPGMEVAGTIAAVGAGVKQFRVGERVVALTGAHFGGHASLALADAQTTIQLPAAVPFEQAVAFPVGYLLMSRALELAAVAPGERVLIQAAAGGVGVIGVQLARELGAEVLVTAGSDAKLAFLQELGAKHSINYQREDFVARIRDLTGGVGVDVVINSLGGVAMQQGLDLLAPGGRYIETAMMALRATEKLDFSRLVNNQAYFSIDLRRFLSSHPARAKQALAGMVKVLAKGQIKPVVAKTFALDQIQQAYRWMEGRHNIGRVVVAVPQAEPVHAGHPLADIAVIGMAGRYPGAADLNAFWQQLAEGRSGVTAVPASRWSIDRHFSPKLRDPGRTYCRQGGFLADIDLFDASFFNLSGTEAARTDPQQRLFLETAWEALEQAGYAQARGLNCGVFVGVGAGDYQHRFLSQNHPPTAHVFSGNQASILAARIAYHLDLHGPALAVDTACSASLVAIHLACESIRSGESAMALAGGVFIAVTPQFHILCSQMGMLSPQGRCAAFDASADGFVPGEGVGAIVLKPLEQALVDGDWIWGVIRGSGMNQDGATNGITAPSAKSQTELEQQVYRRFNIDPNGIGYVETHGTGTPLGDPIEIEALRNSFQRQQTQPRVALGSVKTNIGHAATAAGIAGVTKTLLALHHRQIPPSLHFQRANDLIPFQGSAFYVNTRLEAWPEPTGQARLAAVSAFGFSGTNSHLVLAEAPALPAAPNRAALPLLVCVSGPGLQDARRMVVQLADFLANATDALHWVDVAYTLDVRRPHHAYRIVFLATTLPELYQQLRAYLAGQPIGFRLEGEADPSASDVDSQLEQALERVHQPAHRLEALQQLAQLFIQGIAIPWVELFQDLQPHCMVLPTYAFARKRYWVDESTLEDAPVLLSSQVPTQLNLDLYFVRDHIIEAQALLPGVAYPAFAVARWEQQYQTPVFGVRNLLLLQPLVVSAEPVPIAVHLQAEGTFQVTAGTANTEYARGLLILSEQPPPPNLPPFEQAVQGLVAEPGDVFYARLAQQGYHYGPSLRALSAFYADKQHAVAKLQLPSEAAALDSFKFHPSLLDAALQAVAGFQGGEPLLLPYLIEHLDYYAPLASPMLVHIQPQGSKRYQLSLSRLSGEVLLRMQGITAREAPLALSRYCYRPDFHALGAVQRGFNPSAQDQVLIIYRQGMAALQRELATLHSGQGVQLLKVGSKTQPLGQDHWEIEAGHWADLEQWVKGLPAPHWVYFLAGLQADERLEQLDSMAPLEQQGVLTLWRLLQLFKRQFPTQELVVKAVTNNAVDFPDASIKPLSASLHGFCRSAARELPLIHLMCIDVDLPLAQAQTALASLAAAIAKEPVENSGHLVILREGQRYAPGLTPVRLVESMPRSPYRNGGTYLILGGAGGIGRVLARHLMATANARVILLGRRAPAQVASSLAALQDMTGEAHYLPVDANNRPALLAVIAEVKQRFGPIQGAIHCAMVLQDQLLEQMDEARFNAALHPKTQATVNFCQALAAEPLDFLLLFSSLQSFVGGAGQSNYAAGCTFQDAFAAYWRSQVNYPVRVLHWGYWGSVGVVAAASYRQRLAALGLHSIEPALGMALLDRFLASDWPQLLAVRADKHFLEEIGVRFDAVWHELPRLTPALTVAFDQTLPIGSDDIEPFMREFDALETWCEQWVPTLLAQLGLQPGASRLPTVEELAKQGGILPRFLPLLRALLQTMHRLDYVVQTDSGYRLTDKPFPRWPDLVAWGQTFNTTSLAAFVELVQTCADHFKAILTGQCLATAVLFPQGSDHLVAQIYRHHPIAEAYHQLARRWLQAWLKAHTTAAVQQPIRILEVGGGTASSTLALLPVLDWQTTTYCFTDVSPSLVAKARQTVAKAWPGVDCRVFDLEQDPLQQGFELGSFDLIVAGNVIHATVDVHNTLARLKPLLRAGGWLLLNELTHEHHFATLTFGLLEAWWAFTDPGRRLPHTPLLSPQQWSAVLRENGFYQVQHFGIEGHRSQYQRLLVGQSDGRILRAQAPQLPNKAEAAAHVVPALDSICHQVADIMTRVLEHDGPALDWDTPHQRYGVDSILAVAIIDQINTQLGLNLRSTDFFNFATIRELAHHILDLTPGGGDREDALLDVFRQVASGDLDVEVASQLIRDISEH